MVGNVGFVIDPLPFFLWLYTVYTSTNTRLSVYEIPLLLLYKEANSHITPNIFPTPTLSERYLKVSPTTAFTNKLRIFGRHGTSRF